MKKLMIVLIALLIVGLLPSGVGVASTTESTSTTLAQAKGGPDVVKQVIDQMWVSVESKSGGIMPKAELDKMISYWRVRNWVPSYPIYKEPITGITSLLFIKYGMFRGSIFLGVLLTNTYWDDAGHCPRYTRTGKPVAGWYCIEPDQNASKVTGLASLKQGEGDGGYIETTWENVTAAGKKVLSPEKLAAIKRVMKANGWVAKGKPVWKGTKWLLKFTRVVNLIDNMTAPGTYYDPKGKCLRDAIYGKPMPGQTCIEVSMGKPAGLASLSMGDGCLGVTEGEGVVRSVRGIVPGYSLLRIAVGGGTGYATTMRGFKKDETVLVNYIKCRTEGVVMIEIMYVLHKPKK